MPDGRCSVVTLKGQRMWKLSDTLWDSLKEEMQTSILGYNALVTREEDAVYEFYYDDTGDWYEKTNEIAEALTKLEWHGPCIIMKVDATKQEIENDLERIIYGEKRHYVDVITVEQAKNLKEFVLKLCDLF